MVKRKKDTGDELLAHQSGVIEYFVGKQPEQKGLIVSHSLGSGKTMIGNAFLLNYPTDDTYVFGPIALEKQWITTYKQMKTKKDTGKDFEYINYDSFLRLIYDNKGRKLKGSVAVFDEAHKLYEIIRRVKLKDQIVNREKEITFDIISHFIETMLGFKKVIYMSGTYANPYGPAEFRWLLYFCSYDAKAVPLKESIFTDKYTSPALLTAKYIVETMKITDKSAVANHLTNMYSKIKGEIIGIKNAFYGKKVEERNAERQQELENKLINSIADGVNPEDRLIKYGKMRYDDINKKITSILSINPKDVAIASITNNITRYTTNIAAERIVEMANTLANYTKYSSDEFIKNGLDRYVSYYDIQDDPRYPKSKVSYSYSSYTKKQMALAVKAMVYPEILDVDELVYLGASENPYRASFMDKFDTIRDEELLVISTLVLNGEVPNKFKEISKIYKKKPVNTVIFSMYERSIQNLSLYLNTQGIQNVILTKNNIVNELENFKQGKGKVILLSTEFSTGVNIHTCRQLHILEPPKDLFTKKQVIGRVIRFNSHTSLPVKDRNVNITIWVAQFDARIFNSILTTNVSKKLQYAIKLYQNYLSVVNIEKKFIRTVALDKMFYDSFEKTLSEANIEKMKDQGSLSCCPYIPGSADCKKIKKCMPKITKLDIQRLEDAYEQVPSK